MRTAQQLEKYLPGFRQQMEQFVSFNEEEWAVLCSHLQLKALKRKEHLVHADEVCRELGFVLSGSLRLYHVKDGTERTGYFCLSNHFISSYKSFIKQEPSIPSIQALEDTLLISFSHQAWEALLDHPVTTNKMERFGRKMAENMIFCYEDRMQGFVSQTPEERYANLLNNDPTMLHQVPQHHLANYLGITATSLSRIRRRIFEQ